jgi:hypothetical protein
MPSFRQAAEACLAAGMDSWRAGCSTTRMHRPRSRLPAAHRQHGLQQLGPLLHHGAEPLKLRAVA